MTPSRPPHGGYPGVVQADLPVTIRVRRVESVFNAPEVREAVERLEARRRVRLAELNPFELAILQDVERKVEARILGQLEDLGL